MVIINRLNRKYLMIVLLVIFASSICAFWVSDSTFIVLGASLVNGASRAYTQIYTPVWIDQYGLTKLKTMMLSLEQIVSPLGKVIGSSLATFMGLDNV